MLKFFTKLLASALLLMLISSSFVQAQTTIIIDGDMSDWTQDMRLDVPPNRPIVTWHDGDTFNRTQPADPDDLDFMVDLNVAGIWATDDEDWLYVRIDMNHRADVRRLADPELYTANIRIDLQISADPQFERDLKDTTGMHWGWYQSGVDFAAHVHEVPYNEEYYDTTGFHNVIREHRQWQYDAEGNIVVDTLGNQVRNTGSSFETYRRRPDLGTYYKWNDDFNSVEIKIAKSVLLQPLNINEDLTEHPFVALYVASGAANPRQGETGNQWWQQRAANNSSILGYIYTYQAEWSGTDPVVVSIDDDFNNQPNRFELLGNYPNPFNPTTNIKFNLDKTDNVRIDVYDILGRQVTSMDYGVMQAGTRSVSFDASELTSGMYLYTVTVGNQSVTGKMMLLK